VTWSAYVLLRRLAAHPAATRSLDGWLARWWPAGLIVLALVGAVRPLMSMPMLRGPTLLALLGGLGLLLTTGILGGSGPWSLLPPLAAMLIGLLLLTAGAGRSRVDDPYPTFRAVCAVRTAECTAHRLTHARAIALLGGLRLDFRQAETSPLSDIDWSTSVPGNGAVLDVTALGANVEVVVPPTWLVVSRCAPFTRPVRHYGPRPRDEDLTGRLTITVMTMVGEVTVRAETANSTL
jgi:hypothetical protein